MNESQKRAIYGMVIRMLKEFNLEREDYLKQKKDMYEYLFLTKDAKVKI